MSEVDKLYMRRAMCQFCIKTLDDMDESEPGRADALIEYKRQLASIDAKIAEATGKPPDIVIGLKTASLTGEAH